MANGTEGAPFRTAVIAGEVTTELRNALTGPAPVGIVDRLEAATSALNQLNDAESALAQIPTDNARNLEDTAQASVDQLQEALLSRIANMDIGTMTYAQRIRHLDRLEQLAVVSLKAMVEIDKNPVANLSHSAVRKRINNATDEVTTNIFHDSGRFS